MNKVKLSREDAFRLMRENPNKKAVVNQHGLAYWMDDDETTYFEDRNGESWPCVLGIPRDIDLFVNQEVVIVVEG